MSSNCSANCKKKCCRTRKKIKKSNSCYVGSCKTDNPTSSKCKSNRNYFTLVNGIRTRTYSNFEQTHFYHSLMKNRYDYKPLFQEDRSEFANGVINKVLSDIEVEYILYSYHGKEPISISGKIENDNTLLLPIKGQMINKFYLVNVCDLEIAKKPKLKPEEIVIDPLYPGTTELQKYFNILAEVEFTINCETECLFNQHNLLLCYNIPNDEKHVCIASANKNENIVFNKGGVYAIIRITSYLDFAIDIRENNDKKFDFGYDDNLKIGSVGYSVLFREINIEAAYNDGSDNNPKIYFETLVKNLQKQNQDNNKRQFDENNEGENKRLKHEDDEDEVM